MYNEVVGTWRKANCTFIQPISCVPATISLLLAKTSSMSHALVKFLLNALFFLPVISNRFPLLLRSSNYYCITIHRYKYIQGVTEIQVEN